MNYKTLAAKVAQDTGIEKISVRMAYHQAGYAAAIHFGNQDKQLPPVHFQMSIKPQPKDGQREDSRLAVIVEGFFSKYAVKLEGGRLIQNLPSSFAEAVHKMSWYQQTGYRCAFEADVINLLAGPLAEAKYIMMRDDEVFNVNLINLNALHFYNGSPELELANKYMACYLPNGDERKQKLDELFMSAFRFVDDKNNWRKITALARFIQHQTKAGIIHCEELVCLLDTGMPFSETNSLNLQTMEFC
jgi:hypothetical protein